LKSVEHLATFIWRLIALGTRRMRFV